MFSTHSRILAAAAAAAPLLGVALVAPANATLDASYTLHDCVNGGSVQAVVKVENGLPVVTFKDGKKISLADLEFPPGVDNELGIRVRGYSTDGRKRVDHDSRGEIDTDKQYLSGSADAGSSYKNRKKAWRNDKTTQLTLIEFGAVYNAHSPSEEEVLVATTEGCGPEAPDEDD